MASLVTETHSRFFEAMGADLRAMRESLGFSQQEICELMGWGRFALSKIETGKTSLSLFERQSPSLRAVWALADPKAWNGWRHTIAAHRAGCLGGSLGNQRPLARSGPRARSAAVDERAVLNNASAAAGFDFGAFASNTCRDSL
jgi:transcriptional regulator with XRE-family HTH domain